MGWLGDFVCVSVYVWGRRGGGVGWGKSEAHLTASRHTDVKLVVNPEKARHNPHTASWSMCPLSPGGSTPSVSRATCWWQQRLSCVVTLLALLGLLEVTASLPVVSASQSLSRECISDWQCSLPPIRVALLSHVPVLCCHHPCPCSPFTVPQSTFEHDQQQCVQHCPSVGVTGSIWYLRGTWPPPHSSCGISQPGTVQLAKIPNCYDSPADLQFDCSTSGECVKAALRRCSNGTGSFVCSGVGVATTASCAGSNVACIGAVMLLHACQENS